MCGLHDLMGKATHDQLIKEISDSQCFKDEVAHLHYLIEVLSHTIAMVNEINNLIGLDVILHGVNVGQEGPLV